jgi:hypothetical protein
MSVLGSGASLIRKRAAEASPVGVLLLTRLAAVGGATRAEAVSDLAPLFTHKLSPQEWRRTADKEIAELVAANLAAEAGGRLSASPAGTTAAARFLAQKSLPELAWPEMRDVLLVAKGLGLEKEPQARLKPLARLEGLRALIVQKAYGLPLKKNQPPAKLRAQLAVIALERAFGNRIKAGFGKGSALSAKAGRLLAGQLSQNPRSFATDAKLIAALAAEQAGTVDADLDGLRRALLRRLGTTALESKAADTSRAAPPRLVPELPAATPPAANDRAPSALSPPKAQRPDLGEFARAVKGAASSRAEGWPGSRKAYISHVWQAIRSSAPHWSLSEIEFKCMLAEAHRLGAVVLANADLKDKKNMAEIESSAVPYKNTVWHFVRVED